MAQVPSRQERLHKASTAVTGLALVAFLTVAGATTLTAFQAANEVENRVIANAQNVPKTWDTSETTSVAVNSSLAGKVIDSNYVQFTTSVTNANSDDTVYLTHLASYLTEDGAGVDGFMPLSSTTLEYTYTPEDNDSWQTINLSQPSNDEDGFKLENELHLGMAGTSTDTVYFRYYVTPNEDADTVNDKVSFLMRNDSGETGYTDSSATVGVNAEDTAEQAALANDVNTVEDTESEAETTGALSADNPDEATNDAHVDPLGRFSFVPGIDAITSTVATSGSSIQFIIMGVVVMVVAIGVFIGCLAIYIPLRKQQRKEK